MQGSNFKFSNLSPEHDYITIPILLKFHANSGNTEGEGFNIFAGPQFDLLAQVNKISFMKGSEGDLLADEMTNPAGFSAVFGAGYVFGNGFTISANLNVGLTNVADDRIWTKEVAITREDSYKNIVFQMNFGYRFSLAKKQPARYIPPVGRSHT
jgi:hypothetical protein